MTEAFIGEMQRRWVQRIDNPQSILDADPENVVQRGEMRLWAEQTFGVMPPEIDLEWNATVTRRFRLWVGAQCKKRGLRYRRPTPLQREYERRYARKG